VSIATLSERSKSSRLVEDPLQRPGDWPALPPVVPGTPKFVGLHAVFDHDSNFASVFATVSGGALTYQVDWGDGTVEVVGSSVQKDHNYSFSAAGLSSTTSEGFKIATVTITPVGAATLTSFDLGRKHLQAGLASGYTTGWLDIKASSLVSFILGGSAAVAVPRILRQFEYVGSYTGTTGANMFQDCNSLENLILPFSFSSAFTTMLAMFQNCYSLVAIPPLDTALVTTMSQVFQNCRSLKTIPVLNTTLCTGMSTMCSGCSVLEIFPLDTSHVVGTMTSMFNTCSILKSVPLLDCRGANNMSSTFASCTCLRKVPTLNTTASCLSFNSTFLSCTQLLICPPISNSSGVTSFLNMFSGCSSLQIVPNIDMSAGASGQTAAIPGTPTLCKFDARNIKFSWALPNPSKYSAPELNRIYTNLFGPVTGQTITVTGNPNVAADDPSIATAKGWTVTGS
jgi:hypothetical protein